ncbi:MAG: hypothetical protein COX32_02170 [Candidatus Moranbacteria bacterium CG23_combo_of_CG06-09_8_20_14_all_41_28]|nr:MAG: hypothetical protein COX32_02170 [Candidatus Moranbacteria bacterium CG23_combo_of_CG06-09_8_20_14_all_41_28]HCJ45440.1 hypothetical protein [Candidatus Moranbacteria bacterium]
MKSFQKAPAKGKLRREYFGVFGKRMAYRTTKTENSEVTLSMVEKAFDSSDVKNLPYRTNVGVLIF